MAQTCFASAVLDPEAQDSSRCSSRRECSSKPHRRQGPQVTALKTAFFMRRSPKSRHFRGENHAFVVLWSLKTSVKMMFRMESGHSMAKWKLKLQWSTWNPPMGRRDLNYKALNTSYNIHYVVHALCNTFCTRLCKESLGP